MPDSAPVTRAAAAPEAWFCWLDGSHEAALNMALDEALLAGIRPLGQPVWRCYEWAVPSVSLGYFQPFDTAPAGAVVVRRPTGGGMVQHDGDFTFSLTVPPGHRLTQLPRERSYEAVNGIVSAACKALGVETWLAEQSVTAPDRARMTCFTVPARYDVVSAAGKLAGGAQRRTAHGLLHQGSVALSRLPGVGRSALQQALLAAIQGYHRAPGHLFVPAPELLAAATRLAVARYATPAWNQRR